MRKLLIFIILILPLNVYATELPILNSEKVLIYDRTFEKEIYSLNNEEVTSIASLTKIMTVITAILNIDNLDEEITITYDMLKGLYWDLSVAGLKVNDKVTYRDLLYASMLPSGADATQSLAVLISGSVDNYVLKMNELAKKIGMNNTNFINVTGLDHENHYSTASDILKLLDFALRNDTFKKIYTTREYTLANGLKVNSTLNGFNKKMNLDTTRILGSKTGFTDDAGYCLSSLINSNNHEVIILTLGAERVNNNYYHIIDTLNLVDYVDSEVNELIKEEEERIKKEQELKKAEELRRVQEKKLEALNKRKKIQSIIVVTVSLFALVVLLVRFCNKKVKIK